MEDTQKISEDNGVEECRIGGNNTGTMNTPQLYLSEVVTAIGDIGLTSVNVGDYLIIMNKNIDVTVGDEPYISFVLFYNTMSGRFFKRIWNKTVATGSTTDLSTLIKVCKAYFNHGKPCLALIKEGNQNEMPQNVTSACHSFLTKNCGSEVKMCTECKKTKDTIMNEMRVAEDIKADYFEDIKQEVQCDYFPCEEAFDDAGCKDVMEVGYSDNVVCEQLLETGANLIGESQVNLVKKGEGQNDDDNEPTVRPKLTRIDLIAEALEGDKALDLDEIIRSISDKHTFFNASDTNWKKSLSVCLSATSRFVRANQAKGTKGKGCKAIWRLNTSNNASDKCDYCDESFPEGRKSNKYKWHMKSWHGWNNFQCSSCDFKANYVADVFGHIEEVGHENTTVTCPVCNDNFDKAGMANHYQGCFRKRDRQRMNRWQINHDPCPICGKMLKLKKTLDNHLKMHLRQQGEQEPVTLPLPHSRVKKILYFFCDKCDKKFTEKYWLRKHIQVSL